MRPRLRWRAKAVPKAGTLLRGDRSRVEREREFAVVGRIRCSRVAVEENGAAGAAEDAGVSLRQIEARQQSPDHPILWNVPETDYLKFYIFQIV